MSAQPPGDGPQAPAILIVEARFYDDIADALYAGASAEIARRGGTCERISVPGVLEVPQALALAHRAGLVPMRAHAGGYDGCVALGCVIRGETSHYEVVAGESARALMNLSVQHAIPLGNGILTVENHAQAVERAGTDRRNKGAGAAAACLDLVALARRLHVTQ
ncbi:MAG: 6,7-dimethyl-8-ribityllumazine synthase [Dichotomicrobium sp.]